MSFDNLYYKRTVGTAKACFVCYKPTTTVLATINTVDFVYTCSGHLVDPGFATLVKDEADSASSDISPEEIARVKEQWEKNQKAKKEHEKDNEKDNEKEKDQKKKEIGDKGKDTDKEKKETLKGSTSATRSASRSTPSHERYLLHRRFFAMRQAEHRNRKQVTQAKDLAPRLPSAPTGSI